MTNSSSIQMEDPGQEPKTLSEKLQSHYRNGSPGGSRGTRLVRALFVFQVATQLYVTLQHLLPFVFQGFNPWVLYCLKVFACYLFVMGVANWLCVICYGNEYIPSKDRPNIDVHVFDDNLPDRFGGNISLSPSHSHRLHNGHAVVVDVTEKGGLPWRYCKRCEMMVPPRCHHCKFCHRCMLRRDHHCHLVGCCIGHWNQRYFVVLAAYGLVVGYCGAYLTITYLRHHHDPDDSLWNYFLPYSLFQWATGNISGLQVLLTFHAYMLCFFGPTSNMYCLSQISIIAQGKTLHEVFRNKNVKVTAGVDDNFRLVFGEYWLVNFLFPAQIIFKQTNDGLQYDGIKVGPGPSKEGRDLSDKKARD